LVGAILLKDEVRTDTHELIRRAEVVKGRLIALGIWDEAARLRDYDAAGFRDWMLTLEQLAPVVERIEKRLGIKSAHDSIEG
jgi:hypothetical protein